MKSTPFAEFIRNASPEEKREVYAKVLDAASTEQNMKILDTIWPDGDGIGPGSGE